MNKYNELVSKYPKILGGPGYPAVGEGWLWIIDWLCEELMKTENPPQAVQIKEKFGGLRFYTDGADYIHNQLITRAKTMADTTCDVCGKHGTLRSGDWLVTRCDEHAK